MLKLNIHKCKKGQKSIIIVNYWFISIGNCVRRVKLRIIIRSKTLCCAISLKAISVFSLRQ